MAAHRELRRPVSATDVITARLNRSHRLRPGESVHGNLPRSFVLTELLEEVAVNLIATFHDEEVVATHLHRAVAAHLRAGDRRDKIGGARSHYVVQMLLDLCLPLHHLNPGE